MLLEVHRWQVVLYPPWEDESPVAEFFEENLQLLPRFRHVVERIEQLGFDALLKSMTVRPIRGSNPALYEYRQMGKQAFRILLIAHRRTIVLLHAFKKQSAKLPRQDRETGEQRAAKALAYYEERYDEG